MTLPPRFAPDASGLMICFRWLGAAAIAAVTALSLLVIRLVAVDVMRDPSLWWGVVKGVPLGFTYVLLFGFPLAFGISAALLLALYFATRNASRRTARRSFEIAGTTVGALFFPVIRLLPENGPPGGPSDLKLELVVTAAVMGLAGAFVSWRTVAREWPAD